MKKIVYTFSLGRYFASGANLSGSSNVQSMRGLVYLAKANKPFENVGPRVLNHPLHPTKQPQTLLSNEAAWDYVSQIFCANWSKIKKHINIIGSDVCFVPVPSSNINLSAWQNGERWPALRIAERLERCGLGKVIVSLVLKQTERPSHSGAKKLAHEIHDNLQLIKGIDGKHEVVIIDDVLTHGEHLAAMVKVLENAFSVGAIFVGDTASQGEVGTNCFNPVKREITLDFSETPWGIASQLFFVTATPKPPEAK